MLSAAENSPIAPMNSSTGMPLSTWMFLNASSDVCARCPAPVRPGCGAWAPWPAACAYPGRPHAAAGERDRHEPRDGGPGHNQPHSPRTRLHGVSSDLCVRYYMPMQNPAWLLLAASTL